MCTHVVKSKEGQESCPRRRMVMMSHEARRWCEMHNAATKLNKKEDKLCNGLLKRAKQGGENSISLFY